ncbi:MAG: hypothetical protein ACSLEM_02240 [Candidatus Malihini olakiniferum]
MGRLTKSKDNVTEADIQFVTLIIDRLKLFGEARLDAQQDFVKGNQMPGMY